MNNGIQERVAFNGIDTYDSQVILNGIQNNNQSFCKYLDFFP